MFCPQCKAEYRSGFTHCSDCDVDLVEQLLPKSDYSNIKKMKRVWFCDERESCKYVCAGLNAAGIPFRVKQRKHQFLWNLDEYYEVFVPTEFYDKAKPIAEQGCVDFTDSAEDQRIMELPDVGRPLEHEHDSHSQSWRPEDATVEVWSEKTEERDWFDPVEGKAWMIELSLNENGIGNQVNVTEDGFRRIFVRPEDERQAREIVREIATGSPPT